MYRQTPLSPDYVAWMRRRVDWHAEALVGYRLPFPPAANDSNFETNATFPPHDGGRLEEEDLESYLL